MSFYEDVIGRGYLYKLQKKTTCTFENYALICTAFFHINLQKITLYFVDTALNFWITLLYLDP